MTKIKQDKEKTIIDVKHGKKYRITFYKQINVNLGDKVLISGKFNTPKSNTVFNTFNYRKYLLSKKIILVSNEASITIKHKNKNNRRFYTLKILMLWNAQKNLTIFDLFTTVNFTTK